MTDISASLLLPVDVIKMNQFPPLILFITGAILLEYPACTIFKSVDPGFFL